MEQKQTGSKAYLILNCDGRRIGRLAFRLRYRSDIGCREGFAGILHGCRVISTYTDFWHGFTSSSALIGCIIG